ncbi:MAG: hypothetical protein CVU48_04635 [Candidatus Cloacimonetes bacterium HGW-Cloacimonetes-1]|jgi:hypothetical protein|nr:MAG: hypothetical protein CVU48_04635 [Candidatus Cloacimonetes bacterium HGW-Cloacimonetes-1]
MFFLPLVLGSLAIVFPFLALMLLLAFCGKNGSQCISNPTKSISPFFIVPIILLILVYRTDNLMLASDALYGVGLAVMFFLISIKRNVHINDAITRTALLIIAYGLWRSILFGDVLDKTFDSAISSLQKNFVMFKTESLGVNTVKYMHLLMPAIWTVQQILALMIGFVLFEKNVGIVQGIRKFALPKYFSIILLAILPLYFWDNSFIFFVNALLSLCMLPMLQGLIVLVDRTFSIVPNRMLAGIVLAIILLNIISYLFIVLLGLADQWLDFRKINNGGISA